MKNSDWEIVSETKDHSGINYTFENVLRPFIRVVINVSSISREPEEAAWRYLNETVR
ncbi:hypothetical protein [Campylobacter jejuni]